MWGGGQTVSTARPTRAERSTWPNTRESAESSRLSPMTQKWSGLTRTFLNSEVKVLGRRYGSSTLTSLRHR